MEKQKPTLFLLSSKNMYKSIVIRACGGVLKKYVTLFLVYSVWKFNLL